MSCNVIREALVGCLLKSDCVLRSDPPKSAADCIKEVDSLPEECVHLRKAFFECKRGMLDMRKRFRGLDPGQTKSEAAVKKDLDAQRNQ